MESSSGYIPVSKVPLLETQLMELRTQHDENEEKLERIVKRAADALRNLDAIGFVYRDTDEFNKKVKTLECDEEYIALNKLYEDTETTFDEGEIQIKYLCNKFRACIAVSRLI